MCHSRSYVRMRALKDLVRHAMDGRQDALSVFSYKSCTRQRELPLVFACAPLSKAPAANVSKSPYAFLTAVRGRVFGECSRVFSILCTCRARSVQSREALHAKEPLRTFERWCAQWMCAVLTDSRARECALNGWTHPHLFFAQPGSRDPRREAPHH